MSMWVAGATVVAGVYTANKASKAQNAAANRMGDSADAATALGYEELDWYKKVWEDQAPDRALARDQSKKVSDAQVEGMQFATQQARELDAYNKETFRPIERQLVQEATTFDTPERRMQAAAEAGATVDTAFSATTQANNRALTRAGIAPGDTKAQVLAADTAIQQAKARAGAMTTAVRNTEQQGFARKADMASLGRGLAPTQATQQQIATSAGSAGSTAAQQALAATQSGNGLMAQGFAGAQQGVSTAGRLYAGLTDTYGQMASAANKDLYNAAGAFGSMYAKGAISDKNKKSGTGRMADTAQKLAEVEATPVHDGWTYDPAKGGPDDGGQKHIGPMAQDVQRISGEQAAPGGKVINLPDRMGRMEAAVQELSKRVKKLQKEAA